MQKKICIFCLALFMTCFIPRTHAQQGKSEFAIGYGYYSFYSFLNHGINDGAQYSNSSGSPVFTYRYYLTKDVTVGIGIGYENISNWGTFTTFSPELTVSYLDTRNTTDTRVKLYGSMSYGVSVFEDANAGTPGHFDQSGVKPWAFQATPIGIRIGRQVAFFAELGLGYKGLFHGGLAFRFPKKRVQHAE